MISRYKYYPIMVMFLLLLVSTSFPVSAQIVNCDEYTNSREDEALCNEYGIYEGTFNLDTESSSGSEGNAADRGFRYLESGQYSEAFNECDFELSFNFVSLAYHRARSYVCRGWANYYLGYNGDALDDFNRALSTDRNAATNDVGVWSAAEGLSLLNGEAQSAMNSTTAASSPTALPDSSVSIASLVNSGMIVFEQLGNSSSGLYILDAGATNPRLLERTNFSSMSPSWSPDGTQIVYSGFNSTYEIFVINADGTNMRQLTFEGISSGSPAWSPDGMRIVYRVGAPLGDLYVMDADGTNRQQLTDDDLNNNYPDWSPDGSQIVFSSTYISSDFSVYESNIEIMNADGTNRRQLTQNNTSNEPKWSPDGTQIVYVNDEQITLVNSDGTNLRQLTSSDSVKTSPSWSPDGRQILFSMGESIWDTDLYSMNIDGTNLQQISTGELNALSARWQPTGSP